LQRIGGENWAGKHCGKRKLKGSGRGKRISKITKKKRAREKGPKIANSVDVQTGKRHEKLWERPGKEKTNEEKR